MSFLLGLLVGLYLGLCLGLVTYTLGSWHRRRAHVRIGGRDLGNGPFAYAAVAVLLVVFFPLAFAHDCVFPNQWIEWSGP